MDKYYKIKTLVSSVVLLSSLALAGCGGGSDSTASINGIYSGSITGGNPGASGGEKGIVYNNRLMVVSMPDETQQMFNANLTLTGKAVTAVDAGVYIVYGIKSTTVNMAGSFESGSSITVDFTDSSGNTTSPLADGTISLLAESGIYNAGADLATLAGNWSGPFSYAGDTRMTINADGAFAGDDDLSCTFTGTITVPDATKNVYQVTMDSLCPAGIARPNGINTGFAWTESNNDTLVFLVSSSDGARSVILTRQP